MSDKHLMLDLETLSTRPDGAIISIGAVVFDYDGCYEGGFYEVIHPSTIDGAIDAETVAWWMQQSDDARKIFQPDVAEYQLAGVLSQLQNFCTDNNVKYVWGNSASFDNVMLRSTYERQNMAAPWKWWNDRCYRTMKNMYPQVEMERVGTHHNALDDARSQAEHLIKICDFAGIDL